MSFSKLVIPECCECIGDYFLYNCKQTNVDVEIGPNVSSIGSYAFYGLSIRNIKFAEAGSLALTTIMRLFSIPEEIIQTKVKKVLAMDYRATGLRVLQEFKEYINTKHEKALADFKKRRAKYLREKNKKK